MNKTVIHIGYPKTGSTFLQKYFSSHPSLFYNREIFKNYYTTGKIDETLQRSDIQEAFYILSEEHLSVWAGNTNDVKFKTYNLDYNIKSHQHKVASDLASLFPNAKILIVVRGFESMINSLYSQYLMIGGTMSFKNFIDVQDNTLFDLFDYSYIISIYTKLFSEANVIVLPYELLEEEPQEFLLVVEQFFEFPHVDADLKITNKSLPKCITPLIRLTSRIFLSLARFIPESNQQHFYLKYIGYLYHIKETWLYRIKCSSYGAIKNKSLDKIICTFKKQSAILVKQKYIKKYAEKYC